MKHAHQIAHKHAWKRWGILPLLLSIALTFVIVATVSAAVAITATKTYTIIGDDGDGKADPGETIEYTVVTTNSGSTDATGVTFNDTIDANTTLVPGSLVVSPLALDETYSSVGNMTLTSSAIDPTCGGNPLRSVTCNDLINGSTLVGFGATQPTANGTVVNGSNTVTTSNNGTVLLNTDGTFVYDPAAGFEGADGFWYTLSNSAGNDNAHVTINVGGANGMVWFISSAGGGSGRQANPFTMAAFNTANTGAGNNPAAGDTVFLFEGAHTGPVTLLNNQKFIGQDATVSAPTLGGPAAQPGNAYPASDPTGTTVSITSVGVGITLGSGNNLAGFTVGNATTAITGGVVGTLSVREVTINTNGSGLIIGASGTINNAAPFTGFTGISTTGGVNGIALTGVGGTLNTTGSLTGASGTSFGVNGGTVSVTYGGNITQSSVAPMVSISGGHATGTITFQTGTLNATNGSGLQFSNADGAYNFNGTTTLNGGDAGVDITTGSSGTFSFSTNASINNPSGIAYREDTSTANVTYNGSITKTNNANNAVDINAKTGGTTSFTGAITASTTTVNAIDLTNTGGTVNFSGGLNITTTSGVGFNATGAGSTVNVCDENPCNPAATGALINTLTTTTATALNVNATTIGANNLEFRSISSSGGTATGIILVSTGSTGALVVKGDGGTARGGNGSGGTITNKTGGTDGDGTGASGVYINGGSATLRNMTLTRFDNFGIYGLSVNNVTVQYSTVGAISGTACADGDGDIGTSSGAADAGIVFGKSNPSGLNGFNNAGAALLDNLLVYCSIEHQIEIYQQSNSFSATISNSDVKDNSTSFGSDGIQTEMQGTANGTITVDTVSFDDNKSQAVQGAANDSSTLDMTVKNSTIVRSSQGNEGIILSNGSNGDLIAHVTGNNISGIQGATIFVGQTPGNATAASSLTGYIANNTIVHPPTAVNSAILVWTTSTIGAGAPANVMVTNNNITQNSTSGVSRGIFVDTPDASTNPNFSVTVLSNIVHIQDNVAGLQGIVVQGRQASNACFDVRSNQVDFPNGTPAGISGIRIRQANTAVVNLEQGGSAGAPATVLAANNTSTAEAIGTVSVVGNSTCQTAPVAKAPNTNQALAQYPAEDNRMAASFASNSESNAASAFAPAYDLGSMYQPAAWVAPSEQSASPATISAGPAVALVASDADDRKSGLFAPPTMPALSGETVNVPIGTLPAGKSVTIKFQVTVNNPLPAGTTRILNQSNITYTGGPVGGINTTDPTPSADPACTAAPAIGTATCTPVDLPDTTVSSINRQTPTGANTNASAVTWRVTFADAISGLTSSNFTLLSGGSLSGASITSVTPVGIAPATQWDVLANTGTGDGLLELNMTSGTGLSHDITNLPFTSGEDYTIDRTAPTVASIKRQSPASNPTNADILVFRITFNEAVTSVGANSFVATGTTTTVDPGVTAVTPNLVFDFTVDGTLNGDLATLNGTVGLDVSASPIIKDLAGNTLQVVEPSPASNDETYTMDNTAPSVTINQAAGQADPTSSSTINFLAVFSEPVTGFTGADVTLAGTAGATSANVTEIAPNDGTIYTVAVSGMTTDGTVIASIAAGAAQDVVANDNTASISTDNIVTYDTTAPSVTINQAAGQADPTNTSPISFTVVFNEPVTGFVTGDVTLAGTAGATTGTVTEIAPNDGTTYTVAVSGMTADGTVITSIAAGAAQDAATNGNAASTSTDNTVTYDTTAPSVTINQAAGQADPTNTSPISFTVVFNEPVTGFGTGDVTVGGTAGATTASVTEIAPNDGTTYNVAASGMTADGTVIASIPPGVGQDAAGNGNSASTSADNTVTFDATAPTVTISSAAPEPTNTSPIPVTIQFSEPVTGFVVGDITPGNGTVGNFVAVDGDTYTFDLTPSGQGLVTADIAAGVAQDTAGNDNAAATQFSRTYDTAAPTVTISSTTLDPTNTSPIPVTVQFSEIVSGFVVGDITSGNGTVGNFVAVDGDTYTFDLTPSGQGLVTADIAAAVATDAAGNDNTAATQFSRTYDTVAPTVTIDQAAGQADPTNTSPISFTVVFNEPVTGFTGADVSLAGTAGATSASVTEIAPNDGTTYTVAVSGMTSAGDVMVTLPANAAQDLAGNNSSASTSTDNTVTFDPIIPVVTGIVRADPSPTNAASVQFTVTFAKSVSGVDATDFTFTTSGVSGAAITNVAGGGTTWTVTVNTGAGDGTLRLDLVDDDTIVDGASNPLGGKGLGNGNFTSGEVYTIDRTGPTAASVVRANASPTNAATVDFTITFTEIVTGVDTGDFSLATSGVTGAAITNIVGSGTTWTATVNTGGGSGTIGLNVVDDDTIVDVVGNPLGGTGAGNGSFTGEVYTIDKIAPQAGNLVATNIITGGGSTQTFTIVFSDNLAINIASLDGSDIRVTGPGGFNQPATLVSVTPATNGTPRTATYHISAPGGSWDNADNGAYTVAVQANQVSDTAGNTVAASTLGTFNVDVSVARRLVYLPLIMHSAAQAPDLVVSSVTLNPNKTSFTTSEPVQISVVIKNQGNAPTTPFWVDLYLNPSRTPALNLIWSQICSLKPCYGIAWQITQPLAPGAELTLTSTVSSYAVGYTNWRERLAAGTTDLYVQADSWNPGKVVGASGDTNLANNLFHISGLHVTGQNVAGAGADAAIPERPAAGQR